MGWDRAKNKEKKFKILKNIILASLQAETGWDRLKNREKKNFVPIRSYPTRVRKFKNLKDIILVSFHAETGWDRPKNREKKICFDPFLPDPSMEI